MNSNGSPSWPPGETHPSAEMLFLNLEAELPAAVAARIEAHLKFCWECRAQSENWQEVTRALVDYRRDVQPGLIPNPPSAWSGFRTALQERLWGRPSACGGLSDRHAPGLPHIGNSILFLLRKWLPQRRAFWAASACASLGLVLWLHLSLATAVSANELLERAVAEEKPGPRKAAVRTRPPKPALDSRLPVLFDEAQLDWRNPLSARAFRQWRSGLRQKTDRVTGESSTWTLETSTNEGPIRMAALTVRAADFHPIQQRLRFAGEAEEVEITEVAAEPLRAEAPAPKPKLIAKLVPPAVPTVAAEVPASQLDLAEIDARVALFNTRADLGDQIQIRRSTQGIAVEGILDAAGQKEALTALLRRIPGVEARIQWAGEVASPPNLAATSPVAILESGPTSHPLLAEELEARFPRRDDRSAFVRQIMESSRSALMHAWALRRLAERYGPAQSAALDEESRTKLRELTGNHAASIRQESAQIGANLADWIGGPLPAAPATAGSNWQASALEVFSHIRHMDDSVVALLSRTNAGVTRSGVIQNLRRAQASLAGRLPDLKQQLEKP